VTSTSWRSAPKGTTPCFLCHRYLLPEKLDDGRCVNRVSCTKAAALFPNRARKVSKKQRRDWGWT
jgi:hypothetical protein